jgi:hypothetical protein
LNLDGAHPKCKNKKGTIAIRLTGKAYKV